MVLAEAVLYKVAKGLVLSAEVDAKVEAEIKAGKVKEVQVAAKVAYCQQRKTCHQGSLELAAERVVQCHFQLG